MGQIKVPIYKRDIELPVAIHDVRDVSAFLLQLAIIDCEQSLFSESSQGSAGLERAKFPRGELERERERPHPSFPSADLVFFFFFGSHLSIPRSHDHPEGLLAV